MLTYAYATGYLGMCIFLNQQLFHFSFSYFLLGSWGFLLFRIAWVIVNRAILEDEVERSFPKRKQPAVKDNVEQQIQQSNE
jgi:hypothetical protein